MPKPTDALTKKTVEAVAEAMTVHDERLRLEDGNGPSTQVWHMLWSLLKFCDYFALDFDALLEDARQDMRNSH